MNAQNIRSDFERDVANTMLDAADARVYSLEAAMREIGREISANGCDGPHDAVCINAEVPPEDWCRFCRMGASVTGVLPYGRTPRSGL